MIISGTYYSLKLQGNYQSDMVLSIYVFKNKGYIKKKILFIVWQPFCNVLLVRTQSCFSSKDFSSDINRFIHEFLLRPLTCFPDMAFLGINISTQ